MRNSVKALFIGLIAVLAIVSVVLFAQYQKTNNELTVARTGQEDAEAKYAKTIDDIAEIQDSLNAISLGDTAFGRIPWNAEPGQRMSRADERQALDRIALLRQSISHSRERITQLESRLRKSGVQVASLNRMIKNLKLQLVQKEEIVALLDSRVDDLNTQVAGLSRTVISRDSTISIHEAVIEDKRKELATIYYIVGNKKLLKNAGAIQSSGGVLGLGKTVRPSTMLNYTALTPMDTDQETVIHTSAEKARLVSGQSATSYTWMNVNGQMELHITNPEEFRKIREVVILTS